MSKLFFVLFAVFLSLSLQVSINCNASAGSNVLDVDDVENMDLADIMTDDELCSSGNVCEIKCFHVIPNCQNSVFFAGFWSSIPSEDLERFGRSYLDKCIFQRKEKSASIEPLKDMLAISLGQAKLMRSSSKTFVDSLISKCENTEVAYSTILDEMFLSSEPVLKAMARTYQLLMAVEVSFFEIHLVESLFKKQEF